jgi:hypothetical protein
LHTGKIAVDFPAAMSPVHSIIDGLRDALDDWLAGANGLDRFLAVTSISSGPSDL